MKTIKDNNILYLEAVEKITKYDRMIKAAFESPLDNYSLKTDLIINDISALAELLISKGVFTREEFYEQMRIEIEEKVRSYEYMLSKETGLSAPQRD